MSDVKRLMAVFELLT